jgi:prepilin signal peptidase PulO-like enzyme (type II secretory pathway)
MSRKGGKAVPELLMTGLWIFLACLFGLLIGSFLNVCIYRLPAGITIVRGHSFCPSCRHPLGPADLVPVLSYLFLKRRCRYCGQPISSRYARIELLTGLYFGLAAWLWRPGLDPAGLPAWISRLFAVDGGSAAYWSISLMASVALAASAMLAFCGFLVWAMIFFDGHRAPWGVFVFSAVPIFLRLALQPERLPAHLAAMALSWLLVLLLAVFRLIPDADRQTVLNLGAGVGLLGLMAGLLAIQPVLAVILVELVILALYQNRRGREPNDRRARQLWQSLPLQVTLLGCVLLLIF